MLRRNSLHIELLVALLLGSAVAHARSDILSVNFYAWGRVNQGPDKEWNLPEWRETLTLEPNQAAGVGDWETTGWVNYYVPWSPSAPQKPVTITSASGYRATFTLITCRNGAPYHWTTKRETLLGDGNGDLMDGHANATEQNNKPFEMTMSDIPFGKYDVIVYLGGNEGQWGDGRGKIVFNEGPEQDFYLGPKAEFSGFVEIVDANTAGNYIVYEGVTGSSFTLRVWGNGFNHLAPCGFQIRPVDAPVGHWKLDETSGEIAFDSSGNGHDGILSANPAPLWTTDPDRGNVLEFGPGNDMVDCGAGLSAGENLTVALWVKPADGVTYMRPVTCYDGDYSENPGWFLMLRKDDWAPNVPPNVWFRITGTEGGWDAGDLWINECWTPGEWTHMAFTFDEDTDTLSGYINGEPAGKTVVPEGRSVATETNPLILGATGGENYRGLMSDVYLYDVALTGAQIWKLANPNAIPVPNGSFEEVYKPGSTVIIADLGLNWTRGVGANTPIDHDTVTYSDGTTGASVDVPGWNNTPGYPPSYDWPVGCGSIAGETPAADGFYYYAVNGGDWGNPQGGTIVSDAPVAKVQSGLTYTLSVLVSGPSGPAAPVVLELLADGVPLTPSSSVDPQVSGDWQEFSRTYDAASLDGHLGESLTIRLGIGGGASGAQTLFDAVRLSYVQ